MSQNIFSNINPSATSGNDLATLLNDFKDAVASGFSGTARPANLQAGGYWIDTTLAPTPDFLWKYMMWTGTTDILVFSVNINTNTIIFSGTSGTYTVSQTSADAVGPIIAMLKKRIATNGQTIVGDVLGEIQFKSTDDLGAAMISARIKAVSNNSTTSSQAGAYLVFEEINTNSGSISEKMRLLDGKLGVGTTAPATAIHITSLTGFTNERIDDSANGPTSIMKKSRIAGSGQVLSGDSLGKYNFKSTDETGAEIDSAVVIESFATENHTATEQGSKVTIGIKKIGEDTVTEKMSIGDVVNFPEGHKTKNEVIGSSGTAATNVKLHRSATGKLQVVLGNDATAEGSEATVLAELSGKQETFTNAGKPAAGNIGRVIYVSDTDRYEYDNGTIWQVVNSTFDKLTSVEQISAPATPEAGKRVLYSKADGFYSLDSSGNSVKVGSGAGGGTVNLIADGNADDRASSIFTLYADAAASRPVDGTGGSPNITTAITSTNPLTGTKSYLLTKDAANRQGQGGAITFSVDPSYRTKVLKISVDYIVNSGTFVAGSSTTDSDLIWYLYDVTNSTLIEPSNIKMLASSTTVSEKFEATFQTSATGSSYRLIAHVSTTSASAWELKLDNITVSPSVYVYGTPVTDWQSYNPTYVGFGTVTSSVAYWRRVGDSIQISATGVAGTPTASTALISLPNGLIVDSTKTSTAVKEVGIWTRADGSSNARKRGLMIAINSSGNVINFANDDYVTAVAPNISLAGNAIVGTTQAFTISIQNVAILGWSSSVQMSDSYDGIIIQAKYRYTTAKTSGPTAPLNFDTIVSDQSGFVTTGAAWKFTTQTAGKFVVQVAHNSSGASVTTQLFKNGTVADNIFTSPFSAGNGQLNGSCEIDLIAGDYIDVRFDSSTTSNGGYINIFKIQGPQAIAANGSVNAVYTTAAGQSIPNATDTIINFGDAEINSHGNVTTGAAWKFTAQIGGVYEVSAFVQLVSGGGWNINEEAVASIFKNGSGLATVGLAVATAAHSSSVPIPCNPRQVRLLAGDYIDLRLNQNSSASLGLVAAAVRNWISIKKVGN